VTGHELLSCIFDLNTPRFYVCKPALCGFAGLTVAFQLANNLKLMRSHPYLNAHKLSLAVATLALAWFALGTAINTMVAFSSGKRIDIVVCSGAGVKTVSVALHGSDEAASVIKHCSNAPIYALIALLGVPSNLHFSAPRTVAAWHYKPTERLDMGKVQINRPPPGRAPPAYAVA
jgi:hypothetical protein